MCFIRFLLSAEELDSVNSYVGLWCKMFVKKCNQVNKFGFGDVNLERLVNDEGITRHALEQKSVFPVIRSFDEVSGDKPYLKLQIPLFLICGGVSFV